MFILASHLSNLPIIALQNSAIVANVGDLIIDPTKLELMALYAKQPGWRGQEAVLMVRDIREIAREGLVVDSLEDIEDVSEIVRLKELVEHPFKLMGIKVASESGSNLGHVEDASIDTETYQVDKLYVRPSLLRNFLLNNLVINRKQIVSVTDKEIVVRDATVAKTKLAGRPVPEV